MNINDTLLRAYYNPKELAEELEKESLALYKLQTRKEGRAEGRAEGKALGMAEGEEKKEKEMILNLSEQNISLDIIAKVSKLSLDRVKEIINDYEKKSKNKK